MKEQGSLAAVGAVSAAVSANLGVVTGLLVPTISVLLLAAQSLGQGVFCRLWVVKGESD
jgi:hypothetical protein